MDPNPPSQFLNSSSSSIKTSPSPIIIPHDGNKVSVFPQEANLEVDLSPYMAKVKRKSKNKGSTCYGPKTRSSKGPSPVPTFND